MKRWRRHHRILTEDVLFRLDVANGVAAWSIEERRDLGPYREFCLVTLMRYVLGFACWSIDSRIALARAEFPYPQPEHVSVYPTIFCRDLVFGAPRAKIVFDARYLALPLKRDEADLDHMLQRALPLTVLPYRRDRLLVERVRKLLRDAKTPFATAEDIAEVVAMWTGVPVSRIAGEERRYARLGKCRHRGQHRHDQRGDKRPALHGALSLCAETSPGCGSA